MKGTSRLSVEVTKLSLVDGQQIPVRAQLVQSSGGTSKSRDAIAIAGAGAATIRVLFTRGHATEIFPEEMLTFRTLAPITINTGRSEQAFQPIRQEDYPNTQVSQFVTRPVSVYAPAPFFYGPALEFGLGYAAGWG